MKIIVATQNGDGTYKLVIQETTISEPHGLTKNTTTSSIEIPRARLNVEIFEDDNSNLVTFTA